MIIIARNEIISGEPMSMICKSPIHQEKRMLCIWWNVKGSIRHELLRPGETIIADEYCD